MTESSARTPYMTLEEVADHFRVSVSTFRGWVRKGLVPKTAYISVNSVYRYNVAAVEAALIEKSSHNGEGK